MPLPMRQIILKTGMLLLMVLFITGIQAQNKLYIQAKDGTRSSFPLNEIRKLTFPSRTLIVYDNDGNTEAYPFTELRQARFTQWVAGNNTIDQSGNSRLTLFPNPVSNELKVMIQSSSAEPIEIQILDIQGKTVYFLTEHTLPGYRQINIDLSDLQKGLYVCRVNNGKSRQTRKFLKN